MKGQNKVAEMNIEPLAIGNEWLDDPDVYRIKRTHLLKLQLLPSKDLVILDAACGPGIDGIILAQEGGAKVIGIDISADSIKVANESALRKKAVFLPLVGDLEILPFQDASFDICYCSWALHHFPDMNVTLDELKRVLKTGGKIALVEPNESNPALRFSRFVEDLPLIRQWVLKAGWDTPNRTPHYAQHYTEALKIHGFNNIQMSSCYPGGSKPPTIHSQKGGRTLLRLLFRLRVLVFSVTEKIWPKPLNGTDLLITGIK